MLSDGLCSVDGHDGEALEIWVITPDIISRTFSPGKSLSIIMLGRGVTYSKHQMLLSSNFVWAANRVPTLSQSNAVAVAYLSGIVVRLTRPARATAP